MRVTVTIRFDAEENDSLGFGVLFGSVAPPFLSGSRVKRRKARLVFEVPMQVRRAWVQRGLFCSCCSVLARYVYLALWLGLCWALDA